MPVLLASSAATVTLTNCLPSWVNVLLQSSGSPFLYHATASSTAAAIAVAPEESEMGVCETECLVRTVEDKLFVWTREAVTLSSFLSREAVELEVTQYEAENGHMCSRPQSHALHDLSCS